MAPIATTNDSKQAHLQLQAGEEAALNRRPDASYYNNRKCIQVTWVAGARSSTRELGKLGKNCANSVLPREGFPLVCSDHCCNWGGDLTQFASSQARDTFGTIFCSELFVIVCVWTKNVGVRNIFLCSSEKIMFFFLF